jgi:hypothetical protein
MPLVGHGFEDRNGSGSYTAVLTFDMPVNGGTAAVTSGTGTASGVSFSGNDMIVSLTGVTDVQVITLTVSNVTSTSGGTLSSASIDMGMLIGDTTGDGSVNVADIGQTKSQSGNPVTGSNFREDVTVDDSIDIADIGLVKSKSGNGLPP